MRVLGWKVATALIFVVGSSQAMQAQTTAFNYQGRLTDNGNPANGSYQAQFKLFDSLGGATQIGPTITDVPLTVAQGTFAVKLDFGSNALSGANRWLEIAIRRNSSESYATLAPREQIASSPYAVRTLSAASADMATIATTAATATNALNLGGVAANQFVQTNDPRLSDARNPSPGSANYIQNGVAQQPSSNFNVSGNGTVGTFNANGAVTIGGVAAPGTAPAGQGRFFFDSATNKFRISENGATFVNLVGSSGVNGSGTTNAIPLWSAGTSLGNSALSQIGNNVGIGAAAPLHRLALASGPAWTTHAWSGLLDLENASAIGWRANASTSRFGMGRTTDGFFMFRTASELGNASAIPIYDLKIDNAGNIGVGSIALGSDLSQARVNILNLGLGYGFLNTLGAVSVGSHVDALGGGYGTRSNHPLKFFTNNNVGSPQMTLTTDGNAGIGTTSPSAKLHVVAGSFQVAARLEAPDNAYAALIGGAVGFTNGFEPGGSGPLCILGLTNQTIVLAYCSSSLRYKKDLEAFSSGLKFIDQLHPIAFKWKRDGMADIGFVAEDVAKIDPLFVTYNQRGEIEGVKYDRLSVVFVNALKEQQEQIQAQQRRINLLMKHVCGSNRRAKICRNRK